MITKEEYEKAARIVFNYEVQEKQTQKDKLAFIEKELNEYFAANKVEGRKIKEYRLDLDFYANHATIVPIKPCIEESYSGENDEDIKAIGYKHGIKLFFDIDMYAK